MFSSWLSDFADSDVTCYVACNILHAVWENFGVLNGAAAGQTAALCQKRQMSSLRDKPR